MNSFTQPNFSLWPYDQTWFLVGPLARKENLPEKMDILIAVDGGIDCLPCNWVKGEYFFSIGDQDSTNNDLQMLFKKEKDESDLKLALQLIPKEVKILTLFGFGGGRMDHQLAVFGNLYSFMSKPESKTEYVSLPDMGIHFIPKGKTNIHVVGPFSIMSFAEAKLTIKGDCRYKINDVEALPPLSCRGLSNNGSGIIEIESNEVLAILASSPETIITRREN